MSGAKWMREAMAASGADRKVGVYRKFDVRRTDGADAPGGTHQGCAYWVLDLDHDKHAGPALLAYAESCRSDNPVLAAQLEAMVARGVGTSPKPDQSHDLAAEERDHASRLIREATPVVDDVDDDDAMFWCGDA